MSNILSQDFTVGESGHSNRCSDVRRIIINANVLKAARIHAGEELAIASADVKNAEQVGDLECYCGCTSSSLRYLQ